jgi:DnaA family protein
MKPIQLPLGVRLRDDATFINYYPGANAAALGYVERLCEADAGWTESLIYLWGKDGVGRTHLLQAACLRFRAVGRAGGVFAVGRIAGPRYRNSRQP